MSMDLSATLDAIMSLAGEVNRVHLGRKQKAPSGATVKVGPRGGRYYEVPAGGHPGRAISEPARKKWVERYGERGEKFGRKPEKAPSDVLEAYQHAVASGDEQSAEKLKGEFLDMRRRGVKQAPPPRRESTAEFRKPELLGREPKDRTGSKDNVTQGPWKGPQDPPVDVRQSGEGERFTTRMGSSYEFRDGRSRKDGGEWSDATLFLRPGDARVAAQWQGDAKSNKRVHLVGDEILLTSYSNTQGRQIVDERLRAASDTPQAGLAPLELFGAKGDGRARSFSDARQGTPIR